MLKAIIADNEPGIAKLLAGLLEKHCREVMIKGMANTAIHSMRLIQQKKPDILFLDAALLQTDSNRLMEMVGQHSVQVIFTADNDAFALKAIRYHALDYLVKPLDTADLIQAVKKAVKIKNDKQLIGKQLDGLIQRYSQVPLPEQQRQPILKDRIT